MTLKKIGFSRVFLATGLSLLSSAPLMAAAPTPKGAPPAAEKSAPVASAKVAPAPAPVAPAAGPTVSARKGRGHF